MVLDPKRIGALALHLIPVLVLLGCPRMARAQGTWSVISLLQKPGEVNYPSAVAVDPAGDLYVADYGGGSPRIQKRDAQGNWSVIAAYGTGPGQVYYPWTWPGAGLAADAAGNLYVADQSNGGRVQQRDAQGNWSILAAAGDALGQVNQPTGLAVDTAGNLYVVDGYPNGRIQKRDAQGNWSILAPQGAAALAVDTAGNLYVAETYGGIRKRDAQGNWSVIATYGADLGQVDHPIALAVDGAGNLYVADGYYDYSARTSTSRIQKRDAQGNWSVIATAGAALGQVIGPRGLAADSGGNLYVAENRWYWHGSSDEGNDRIQKRDAQGNWSLTATRAAAPGQVWAPSTLAVDSAGNLYVVDYSNNTRIQKRDAQGNWSVVATQGKDPGQVWAPSTLAVDPAGNLYVADYPSETGRIQRRDPQGNWSVMAAVDPIYHVVDSTFESRPAYLAGDTAGNLYVAVYYLGIQKRDAQGNWSILVGDQFFNPRALAVDTAGSLYVAEYYYDSAAGDFLNRIRKRDAQGNWSVIARPGRWPATALAPGQVTNPTALAVDAAGNLYVAEPFDDSLIVGLQNWIQRRDAQGNWSLIATWGSALGQVYFDFFDRTRGGVAVDGSGNLYVADSENNRVQMYTPQP